jgi:DNA-binding Lrp family transcriptional regulator
MRHGLDYSMQAYSLLFPKHFVTVDNTFVDRLNGGSIYNETSKKTSNWISPKITIDDSQRPHSRLNKDNYYYNTEDDYILSIKDLHRIDRKILRLLTEQPWSIYSFKALERKLSVHQQTLARSLRRLVELSLIEKSPAGYRLNEMNAPSILSLSENSTINLFGEEELLLEDPSKSKKQRKFNQLLQIYLPVKVVDVKQVVDRLTRKWFGNLRWLGLVKKDTGYRLEWVVRGKYEDNDLFRINVTIVSEYVIAESDAETMSDKIEAVSYSNKIVGEIIKGFKRDLTETPDIKKTYHQVFAEDIKYKVKKGK